jgi:hypothetical protein
MMDGRANVLMDESISTVLIRWEKRKENYLEVAHLTCACIAIGTIQVFDRLLIY